MNVDNKGMILHLSRKTLSASRIRNIIAIMAIALTSLLFTSLFTVVMCAIDGFQQGIFRQVGGDFHGTFKALTREQYDELSEDKLIKEYGGRLFLGIASDEPFTKVQVEVSYMDDICARHYFVKPEYGRLPTEKNELATDTRVLSLLGIEPEIGAEVHFPFYIDENTDLPTLIDRTYILSGWWETDSASSVSFVNLSLDSAKEIAFLSGGVAGTSTGLWSLNVMYNSSLGIDKKMQDVLKRHGYQNIGPGDGDNYIATGVNWAYTGASMGFDAQTLFMVGLPLLLIALSGYLIIYNVFRISVSNDIRFYGLLKTIGTTGKQIRRMIINQAFILSMAGIPGGLFLGWLLGIKLAPLFVRHLNNAKMEVSAKPVIFIGSSVFALVTVLVSCLKPGKIAGKVSPVEAVRYTEGYKSNKNYRESEHISFSSFAMANMGRNRWKTVITVLSISLAVLLLNMTVIFTNGFDLDKYISNFVAADFIMAKTDYFQVGKFWNSDAAVPEDVIEMFLSQDGVKAGGCTYGKTFDAWEFISEEYFREKYGTWNSKDAVDSYLSQRERLEDGRVADDVKLYGMDPFCLGKLKVLEGDLSKLYESDGRYMAAVRYEDETGTADEFSNWAKIGEKVVLRHVTRLEYRDPDTGEIYDKETYLSNNVVCREQAAEYEEMEYEVVAVVSVPTPLSYRYYGDDEFILSSETFLHDFCGGRGSVMYVAFDMEDDISTRQMERFLSDYTENVDGSFKYESRAAFEKEFYDLRSMFLLFGGVLSLIIGMVSVLNFFNSVFTGIVTRRHEFAMLQAVGMESRQLRRMLTMEGVFYALSAGILSVFLALVLNPVLAGVFEKLFWFFTFKFTIMPVIVTVPLFILVGAALPLIIYKFAADQSIVERLRSVE